MNSLNTITYRAMPSADDIHRTVLPNGIIILARENFANQSVVISGSVEAGDLCEREDQAGLAGFIAAALLRGAGGRTFDAIYDVLEDMAARLNLSAGAFGVSFQGKCLAEDLPTTLSVLADALIRPDFPTDQVERLRGEILTGLRMSQQNTRAVAADVFRQLLYPQGHPFAVGTQQQLNSLPTLTMDDMHAFHSQFYGPRQMLIVVVGAIKAEEAVRMVADALGGWQQPNQAPQPEAPPIPALTTIHQARHHLKGKTQADLLLGCVGPSRLDPDYIAATLANNILGVFGMMGRVGAAVRDREGFAYYANSRMSGGRARGSWYATAGVNPKNIDEAIRLIQHEIQRLIEEPVSAEELADNQAYFVGHMPLTLETNEGVASILTGMERYNLGLNYLREYPAMVEAITISDIQQATARYLSTSAYALAIAAPE
jgi:zinc protease